MKDTEKKEIINEYKKHLITAKVASEKLNIPIRTFFRKIKQENLYWYETDEFKNDKEKYIHNECSLRFLAKKYNKPVSTIHKHFLKDAKPKYIEITPYYNNVEIGDIIDHYLYGHGLVESEDKLYFYIRFFNTNGFCQMYKNIQKFKLIKKGNFNEKRKITI